MTSPQRRAFLDFSRPHINYPMVIVTEKEGQFISSIEDLHNKQVAVVAGYVTEDILRNNHPDIQLKPAKNLQQALEWVSLGEVDALVDNLASITHNISKTGITNLRISGTTPYRFSLGIAVLKRHKILLGIIQKSLDSITEEQHRKIRNQWISVNYEKLSPDYKKLTYYSIGFIAIILLVLLWNWRLSREIHARKVAEKALYENQKILEYKNHILELLSSDCDLKTVLENLVQSLETAHPEMIASILLLDKQKKHLVNGVALSLPEHYMQAIEGLEVRHGAGSCGTSAFTLEPVIVEDIQTHPYWEGYRELAQSANIRACWSQPIISSINEILGTFVIYYRFPKKTNQSNRHLIHEFAVLTALAIEKFQKNQELKKLTVAVEQSPSSIVMTDLAGNLEYVNPRFSEVTGYNPEEALGKNPRILQSGLTPKATYDDLWDTLRKGQTWRGEFINKRKNDELYWEHAVISPIRDEQGNTVNYVGVKEDITQYKQVEEQNTRLGRILEDSLNEIYIFDATTFLFTQVNKGARHNLGYSMKELKKLTPVDIKPDYSIESFKELVKPLYAGTKPFLVFKTRHRRKDGSCYPVEAHLQLAQAEISSVFVAIIQRLSGKTLNRFCKH